MYLKKIENDLWRATYTELNISAVGTWEECNRKILKIIELNLKGLI